MSSHDDDFKTKIRFEWALETVYWDEDEDLQDIEDSDYRASLSDYGADDLADAIAQKRFVRKDGIECFTRLSLRRDRGCDAEGIEDRQYAYVVSGTLPERFDGGAKIPERFIAQLAKATGT